jgi:DNA topoisomerase IA
MYINPILLICLFIINIAFLICGYILGSKKQIITIEKGDTVITTKQDYVDFDEEASYITPEMEKEYEAKLKSVMNNEL